MGGAWYGFDLDGTLAHYDRTAWRGPLHIGAPVPRMIARLKRHLAEGVECRIVTARVSGPRGSAEVAATRAAIEAWCLEHVGVVLPVTCQKDYGMLVLYDDRARQVIENEGIVVGEAA